MRSRIAEGGEATVDADGDDASSGDGDPRVGAFLRGVTIGALVGAAIAGSALWERAARRRAAADAADAADAAETPAPGAVAPAPGTAALPGDSAPRP